MSDSLDRFIQLLLRSGLITESQLSGIRSQLTADDSSTVSLQFADKLAESGHLTPFQSQELRQGNIEDLLVDDYIILEFVDKGGMGQIFKAQHALMKREVAIKFTLPDADGTVHQSAIDRFQREVEAASKLSHPNIVSSLDAGQRGEVCYLVMEYVHGTNLTRHVRKNGPMAFHQALDCMIQTAQGLEYSHKKGVVHRDIKPSNLLLTDDGQIKILDMGLVRVRPTDESQVSQKPSEQLTEHGQLLGSLDFMAPEQAIDPHSVDKPADIYSLGCTLYYILTGTPPFRREGATQMSRLIAHREDPIPLLCSVRADVPKQFEPIFQKMMAKQQQKRYQSLSELIVDLRKTQHLIGPADSAFEETVSMAPAAHESSATRTRRAVGIVAAIVMSAIGIWAVIGRDSVPDSPEEILPIITAEDGPATMPAITELTDLLQTLDLESSVLAGEGWQVSDQKLSIPGDIASKLCVPVLLPQNFRLHIAIQRKTKDGPFILGFKDDERQCYLLIDALRKKTPDDIHLSAIGTIAGKLAVTSQNEIFLNVDEVTELRLDVDETSVSLTCDEEPVMHWIGDFSDMSLGAGWGVGDRFGVLIGSNDRATFEIRKLEIEPATVIENTEPIEPLER